MPKFLSCIIIAGLLLFSQSCEKSATFADGREPRTVSKQWRHLSTENGDIPVPGPSTQQTALMVLDVDQDGRKDFVIGCRKKAPSVFWYRNEGKGWAKYVLDASLLPIEAGGSFHDIDGDGDLDIVFGADYSGNKVWWWENPYPNYQPTVSWVRREIKNTGLNQHHDQVFGDFDGDGQAELVFWNQKANKLYSAEIPADPHSAAVWSFTEIFESTSGSEGLAASDIDGDGTLDIVGGGRWFKLSDESSFIPNIIDDEQKFSRVAVGQIKKGGRPEVVFVVGDGIGRLKWYEWQGDAWHGRELLKFDVDHGHSLAIADFDLDGNQDIFCGEMRLNGKNNDAKIWIFFGDGNGNFETKIIAIGFGVHEAKVADLDNDGDIDILGKPYDWQTPRIDIWLNNISKNSTLSLDQWRRHVIDSEKPWRAMFITGADLDNDGLKDIAAGGYWYKNPGVLVAEWRRNSFGSPLYNMALVDDFDADGDLDILGTKGKGAEGNPGFVWAQNNGSGSFKILENVPNGDGDFLQGVALGRYQEDDVASVALSWHAAGKGIQVLSVPANPADQPWRLGIIHQDSQDECLSSGDIDGDGYVDLLLGTKWLRNNHFSWESYTIDEKEGNPDRNRLADINGDGKLDAVVGFEAISKKGRLVWYEQGASATAVWEEHLIDHVIGPMSLDVADMDSDGDIDVIVGEHNMDDPPSARLLVYENEDGRGKAWKSHIVYKGDEHHDGARVFDMDEDGDYDIISIGWGHKKVILYENLAIHDAS